jgi:hypothetical protein
VGLRPGEKLHEQLFYAQETVEPTVNAKVLRALAPPPPPSVRGDVRRLLAMASGEDEAALRLALLGYVQRLGDTPPAIERADMSRWGYVGGIDATRGESRGTARAATI